MSKQSSEFSDDDETLPRKGRKRRRKRKWEVEWRMHPAHKSAAEFPKWAEWSRWKRYHSKEAAVTALKQLRHSRGYPWEYRLAKSGPHKEEIDYFNMMKMLDVELGEEDDPTKL